MKTDKRYWIYAPGENANMWDEFYQDGIMALAWDYLEDLNSFKDKKDIEQRLQLEENTTNSMRNAATANNDFKEKMSVGDIIFVKKGRSELLGYGVVTSDYYYNETRSHYKHCRNVEWKKKGVWKTNHNLVLKTLTDITNSSNRNPNFNHYYEVLFNLMESKSNFNMNTTSYPLNQILYGPPGTGKTYSTVELAYEIIHNAKPNSYEEARNWYKTALANTEDRQVDFITFHQNYSYEDFVMGIKPQLGDDTLGFREHKGIFFEICQRALKNLLDSQKPIEVIKQEIGIEDLFEDFKNDIIDQIDTSPNRRLELNDNVYTEYVFDDAFSYSGENWKHQLRMKFTDILKIYNNPKAINRKEAKKTPDISRTAEEHITYFFKMVTLFKDFTKNHNIGGNNIQPITLKNYVLIIDEINRANISRVFGELITLIEEDKRWGNEFETEVRLPDGVTKFTVPKNLYIIGTMNTADKSIALLDIALRRRFNFVPLYPDVTKVAKKYQAFFEELNKQIITKKGIDFCIGHSYFMESSGKIFDFVNTMNSKVIPLLNEYFYNPKSNREVVSLIENALKATLPTFKVQEGMFQLTIQANDNT